MWLWRLFISVIEYIHHRIDVSLEQLFSNLYGVDIESYSIERTKILLSLFAIQMERILEL